MARLPLGPERRAGLFGPDRGRRLVIATVDRATLPEAATGYRATALSVAATDLAGIVRLSSLRNGVKQQYKQVKTSLNWSQYQVWSDRAMRRHWTPVPNAIAFCWQAETRGPSPVMHVAADATPTAGHGPRSPHCWPLALRRVRAWILSRSWRLEHPATPTTLAGPAQPAAPGHLVRRCDSS